MAEHEAATQQSSQVARSRAAAETTPVLAASSYAAVCGPTADTILGPTNSPTQAMSRLGGLGMLALQRTAGNRAVASVVQRAPVKEEKRVLSDAQVEQIAVDVDRLQQELVRVEERTVTIGKINLFYSSWLDAVNSAVTQVKKEESEKDVAALEPSIVMTLLLGAFSMLAGPAVGAVTGLVTKRLTEVGTGVEKAIRLKAIEMASSTAAKRVEPSQAEIAAVVLAVKGKLDTKWKALTDEAGKADLSTLLPKPKAGASVESLDGVVTAMKQAQAIAMSKAIDATGSRTAGQLIADSAGLDPAKLTRGVIEGQMLKELRSLVDTVRAQGRGGNKTFRIDAWGSTGVAILSYTPARIGSWQKATYSFVSWIPPSTVEAMGGAEQYPVFDLGAHTGPNVNAFDGVLVGFLPPPTFATPYFAMIDEYGRARPALVQDVDGVPHFVRWVPTGEKEYEESRGAAKTFGYGEVKGVKPLDYSPPVR